MRLLIVLAFTAALSYSVFYFLRKTRLVAIIISTSVFFLILGFIAIVSMQKGESPDGWCGRYHSTTAYPPEKLVSAMDYFENANYEFDKGNCTKAIEEYSKSIEINPNYAQAYNNRAYTYMRLREFDKALFDLNKALSMNPNYINALRNRGDVYSKIPDYQKAEVDYELAIKLGNRDNLCGDLFTARNDGNFWKSLLNFPSLFKC